MSTSGTANRDERDRVIRDVEAWLDAQEKWPMDPRVLLVVLGSSI